MLPAGKTALFEPSRRRRRLTSLKSDRKSTSSLARVGADMRRLCSLTSSVNDIAARRLHAQRLTGAPFTSPLDAIRWLTAGQAQDYGAAKWALAQRSRATTDVELDRLFAHGPTLRTPLLPPPCPFVLPHPLAFFLHLTT